MARPPADVDAVVFDLDGVITDTARVHAAAWKRVFDDYLRERAARLEEPFEPFSIDHDYRRYVDGKPRYDGVASFLASRRIELPRGEPGDDPREETICGVGNRKNEEFVRELEEHGVVAFPSSVELVRELRERGYPTAIISASRNCVPVLRAAGIEDLFDTKVDGVDMAKLGLPGKPDPAIFCEAARALGARPERVAVVEDAVAGVEAGRRGEFGLVVGVAREDGARELLEGSADVVVGDLAELRPWFARGPRE